MKEDGGLNFSPAHLTPSTAATTSTMTVIGLPTAVETLLTTLLVDHKLSSWKVSAEEQEAVVILRLSSASVCQDGVSQLHTGHWKKKSPAQVRRDRARAAQKQANKQQQLTQQQQQEQQQQRQTQQRQEQQQQQQTTTTTTNPPTLDSVDNSSRECVSICDIDNNAEKNCSVICEGMSRDQSFANVLTENDAINSRCDASQIFVLSPDNPFTGPLLVDKACVTELERAPRAPDSGSRLPDCPVTQLDCESVSASDVYGAQYDTHNESEDSDTEQQYLEALASETGYTLEEIKTRVGTITNPSRQRQLKDSKRNTRIMKGVVDRRGQREMVICHSEDFVFYYDCKTRDRGWLIKSPPGQPASRRESDCFHCLMTFPPTTDACYDHCLQQMNKDLIVATKLVKLLLG